ncbi:MAG: hypothetical protein JNL81_12070 [Hyphomonadaceae bacterium]|nr:hypothetical protein [Hyphomonadaceae bacterium]
MRALIIGAAIAAAMLLAIGNSMAQDQNVCVSACLEQMRVCSGGQYNESCAIEARSCSQRCTGSLPARSFYCRMEATTAGGMLYNDGVCVGSAGQTYEEQRAACERQFAPPSHVSTFSHTVTCTPS